MSTETKANTPSAPVATPATEDEARKKKAAVRRMLKAFGAIR